MIPSRGNRRGNVGAARTSAVVEKSWSSTLRRTGRGRGRGDNFVLTEDREGQRKRKTWALAMAAAPLSREINQCAALEVDTGLIPFSRRMPSPGDPTADPAG